MSDPIGALRARVRVLRPVRTSDDLGGAAIAWSDEGAIWAHIVETGASESAAFDALRPSVSASVRIRTGRAIAAGWRVAWGARVFRVLAVRADEAAWLNLSCEEVSP